MTEYSAWPAPDNSGLQRADEYLTLARWVAITIGLIVSALPTVGGLPSTVWVSVPGAFGTAFAVNLLLSAYVIRRRPFSTGDAYPVLLVDIVQAGVSTLLIGGYLSAFVALYVLLIAELAIALPTRQAALALIGISAMRVVTAILNDLGNWTPLAAGIIAGQFLVLLLIGSLLLAFFWWLRSEQHTRRLAEGYTARLRMVNDLLLYLNEPGVALDKTMRTLLEAARDVLGAEVSVAAVYDAQNDSWEIVAKDGDMLERLQDEDVDHWGHRLNQQDHLTIGPVYDGRPLSGAWPEVGLGMLAGIRVHRLANAAQGALIIGRRERPLDETEWLLLRALGREAELAARNAHHIELRESFLSALAHELYTPLTVLKSMLPNLPNWTQISSANQKAIIEMSEQNLARLELLTGEFLDIVRFESGQVKLHLQPLSLAERLQHVQERLEPLFASKQQELAIDLSATAPIVHADRRCVDRVLSNLLHNAHKFAPAGGRIQLLWQLDGQWLRVCVEDNGPGVSGSVREHLFEEFYAGPSALKSAGMGLGLYISRKLITLHNGHIWHEDRPGGGSRFWFTLPIMTESEMRTSDQDLDHR